MTGIFRVVSQSEPLAYQKQDGTQSQKSTITLQELGGYKDEGKIIAQMWGKDAQCRYLSGALVAVNLRFCTHDYEGRSFQDIFVNDIRKLN